MPYQRYWCRFRWATGDGLGSRGWKGLRLCQCARDDHSGCALEYRDATKAVLCCFHQVLGLVRLPLYLVAPFRTHVTHIRVRTSLEQKYSARGTGELAEVVQRVGRVGGAWFGLALASLVW
jgi:hypothetical protein